MLLRAAPERILGSQDGLSASGLHRSLLGPSHSHELAPEASDTLGQLGGGSTWGVGSGPVASRLLEVELR